MLGPGLLHLAELGPGRAGFGTGILHDGVEPHGTGLEKNVVLDAQ